MIVSASVTSVAYGAETAAQFVANSVAKIKSAGGIKASFKLSTSQGAVSGTLCQQGSLFSLTSGATSTWYDGKNLWTYNPQSNETTLVNPTAEELAESNPITYLNSATKFNAAFASGAPKGCKTVTLTPKSKKQGIKSVQLTINATTGMPVKIVVNPSSGSSATISISSVTKGNKFPSSTFKYPGKRYPGVKVVDLR